MRLGEHPRVRLMLGEEQLQRVGTGQGQDSIGVCRSRSGLYWNVRGLSRRGRGGGGGVGSHLAPYLHPLCWVSDPGPLYPQPHPSLPSQSCLFMARGTGRAWGGQRPSAGEGQTQPGRMDARLAFPFGLVTFVSS